MKKPPSNFSEVRMIVVILIFSILFGTTLVLGIILWAEFKKSTLGIILIGLSVLVLIFFLPILAGYRKRHRQILEEAKLEFLAKIDGSDAFVPVTWGIITHAEISKTGFGAHFLADRIQLDGESSKVFLLSSFLEIIQFPGNMPWIVLSTENNMEGVALEGIVLIDTPLVRKHLEVRTGKPIDTTAHDRAYAEYLEIQKQTQEWGRNTTLQFQKVMFVLFVILGSVALGLILLQVTSLTFDGTMIVLSLISIPCLLFGYPKLFSNTSKKRYAMNPQGFMIFHGRKSYGERWKNLICLETTSKGIICVFETNQGEEGKVFFEVDERFLSSLKDYPILVREHSSNELDQ